MFISSTRSILARMLISMYSTSGLVVSERFCFTSSSMQVQVFVFEKQP